MTSDGGSSYVIGTLYPPPKKAEKRRYFFVEAPTNSASRLHVSSCSETRSLTSLREASITTGQSHGRTWRSLGTPRITCTIWIHETPRLLCHFASPIRQWKISHSYKTGRGLCPSSPTLCLMPYFLQNFLLFVCGIPCNKYAVFPAVRRFFD